LTPLLPLRYGFKRAKLIGMRTTLFCVLALFLFSTVSAIGQDATGAPKPALYHVVSIKFKEGTKPEQIKAVEDAFAALKTKIPGVVTLNYGTNVSPENRNKGFTHCFVLTFASDKDRDAYLAHDEHKAFGAVLLPVLDDVMVIDFWAKN
jgi:hypothetical protein